jgi:hypothetical protein
MNKSPNSREKKLSTREIWNSKKLNVPELKLLKAEETSKTYSWKPSTLLKRKDNTSMLCSKTMRKDSTSSTWFGVHFQRLRKDGLREMSSTI